MKRLLPIAALPLCALLAACSSAPKKSFVTGGDASVVLHQKIGVVAQVDATGKTAVIHLEDLEQLPVPGTELLARDFEMTPVALLQTARMTTGNFFGATLKSGEVRVGDLVFLPDPIPLSERDPMSTTPMGGTPKAAR